jgi:hypothetical protein
VLIIETRRTEAEHQANLAAGRSWTKHSKHIDGLAIDVGLIARLKEKNWNPEHPDWLRLGEIGEACGLKWGGRWKQTPDFVHFEFCPVAIPEEWSMVGERPMNCGEGR